MTALEPSQALLVIALGSCGYLAALGLWFDERADGPSRWASAWAVVSVGVGAARIVELNTQDGATAVLMGRIQMACAPLVMLTVVRLIGSVTEWRPSDRVRHACYGAAASLSALALLTPWFQTDEVFLAPSLGGRLYLSARAGPLTPLMPLLVVGTLGWCSARTWRSPALPRRERWIVVLGLGVYAALGLSTLVGALAGGGFPGLVEYSPLLMAVLAGHLIAAHQRRLEADLQRQVDERSRALRESEAIYRGVVENAPLGLLSIDARGQLEHANERLLAMLGSTRAQFASSFNVAGEEQSRGSGFSAMLERALATGRPDAAEFEFDTWWGRRMATRTLVAPYRDDSGAVRGALAIVDDITERRAVERRIGQAQQLEAIGQLAAGIAHEMNNPMAYVRSNLSVLGEELDALAKELAGSRASAPALWEIRGLEARVAPAVAQVDTIVGIVQDLREFSRSGAGEREKVDVDALLENAVRLAATRGAGNARLELARGDAGVVLATPGQLRLAFLNLLLHALRAAGPGSTAHASTSGTESEIRVSVHDDGPTLSPEARARLFEPLGLDRGDAEPNIGLFIARQIVREHGGEIEALPGAARGTTFLVRLPRSRERSE